MQVTVELYATFGLYLPPGSTGRKTSLALSDGATVDTVIDHFKLPREMGMIILHNGHQAKNEEKLQDGDTLSFFPPLAGGSPLAWPPLAGPGRGDRAVP